MSHIFISYSRQDISIAGKIVNALANNNLDTWIDWKSIPKGEKWVEEIYRGIEEADAFLFLISPDSVSSDMCNREIEHAVANGKRILPIVIRDTDPKNIHPEISKRNWIFCRDKRDDFIKAIEDACQTIHIDYEWLKYHTELQVKALRWEQHKDTSQFLHGKQLQEAERRLALDGLKYPQPTELQHRFMLLSRKYAEKQKARLIVGVVFAAFIIIITLIVATIRITSERNRAEEQRDIARGGELALQALSHKDTEFDLALLLSIEAFRTFDNHQTRQALFTTAYYEPRLLRFFQGESGAISDVEYSPEYQTLAWVDSDGSVELWNAMAMQSLGELLPGNYEPTEMEFSPNAKTIALGFGDGKIQLWDVDTRLPLSGKLSGHDRQITSLVFNVDGSILASSSYDHTVRLWDATTLQPLGNPLLYSPGTGMLRLVLYQEDEYLILAAGGDEGYKIWSVPSGRLENEKIFDVPIYAIGFSPNGSLLATGSGDGVLQLWDEEWNPLGEPLMQKSMPIDRVAFNARGNILAAAMRDNTIWLWDIDSRQALGEPLSGHTNYITELAFSANGKTLISSSLDGTVRFWDISIWSTIGLGVAAGPFVQEMIYMPDGNIFSSDGEDIRMWQGKTGDLIGEPVELTVEFIDKIAFSADGKTMATLDYKNAIQLWSVSTLLPLGDSLLGYSEQVNCITFSPDNKMVAAGGYDSTVQLWDVNSRKARHFSADFRPVTSITFSHNGKMLAVGDLGGDIWLWDVRTSKTVGHVIMRDRTNVYSIEFSPDNKVLAAGNSDGYVELWDIDDGKPLSEPLLGHKNPVADLAFSLDGKILASGGWDGTIRLWDINIMQSFGDPLEVNLGPVTKVTFSPDGKTLASGGINNAIYFWSLDPSRWIDRSCQRAGRNFTEAEWQQYFPGESYRITCPQWSAGQ